MAFQKQHPGIILILLAFCFSLGGCGAPLLSERQIVRAVLFSQTAERAEAVLLLANTSEADAETFHTLSGVGQTPAEALNQAQQASQGPVFYGLMDLVVLPMNASYKEICSYTSLLEQTVLPAARMDIILWQREGPASVQEQAPALYAAIKAAQKQYGIRNGLYQVTAQSNNCALPVWQGGRFGFAWLQMDKKAILISDGLQAQLAATLAGQGNRLEVWLSNGAVACTARTSVRWESDADTITAEVTLHDLTLTNLDGQPRPETESRKLLEAEMRTAFDAVLGATVPVQDPLRVRLWAFQRNGAAREPATAALSVRFAD